MMKNAFYFIFLFRLQLFLFSRYLIFLFWLSGQVERQLNSKDKVNFKIYGATTWLTSNYDTHIIQYLTKYKQSGNES